METSPAKLLPVDHDKLTQQSGATPITPELLESFERVTGKKAHRLMSIMLWELGSLQEGFHY